MENKTIKIYTDLNKALELLRRTVPFIQRFYESSIYGTGAKKLVEEIEAFVASFTR